MSIDVSGLFELADDLGAAAGRVAGAVRPPVQRSAQQLKDKMAGDFDRSKHFRNIGKTVSFSTDFTTDGVRAEVGPRRGGAGSLAGIAYFGGANGGGGTIRDPQDAADEIADDFEKGVHDAVRDLL